MEIPKILLLGIIVCVPIFNVMPVSVVSSYSLVGVTQRSQEIEKISESKYSQELQDAYNFAYQNKITTQNSIDKADMNGGLTRIAMAKMLSQYAINILGKSPDTSKIPNFGDVDSKLDGDYNNGVTLAYQLGIMGVGIDKFRPFDSVTRAEFGTALSRVLYGDKYEGGTQYYTNHLNALKSAGIMNQINQPNQGEIRGFVMLMLMRAQKDDGGKISGILNVIDNENNNINNDKNNGNYNSSGNNNKDNIVNGTIIANLGGTYTIEYKTGNVFEFQPRKLEYKYNIKEKTIAEVYTITFKKVGNLNLSNIKSVYLEDDNGNTISDVIYKLSDDVFELKLKNQSTSTWEGGSTLENYVYTVCKTIKINAQIDDFGKQDTLGFQLIDIKHNAKNLEIKELYNITVRKLARNLYSVVPKLKNFSLTVNNSQEEYDDWDLNYREILNFTVNGGNSEIKEVTIYNNGDINLKDYIDSVKVYVGGEEINIYSKYLKISDNTIRFVGLPGGAFSLPRSGNFSIKVMLKKIGDKTSFAFYIRDKSDIIFEDSNESFDAENIFNVGKEYAKYNIKTALPMKKTETNDDTHNDENDSTNEYNIDNSTNSNENDETKNNETENNIEYGENNNEEADNS